MTMWAEWNEAVVSSVRRQSAAGDNVGNGLRNDKAARASTGDAPTAGAILLAGGVVPAGISIHTASLTRWL